MKKQNNQQFGKKNINKKILFISIAILIIGLLFNKFRHSLFITRPDRLNLVFYGQNTTFYSLDLENRIHYRINFSPDIRLIVPGGYDEYRVGSLGKLIKLENKPKLLRQTFSAALSNFVHLYFYPDNNLIYQQENNYSKSLPSIKQLIANKSNAGWLDRLYLFILFFIQGREINQNIASLVVTDKDNDRVWQREDFMKKYLGYWYSKDLRQERAAAQVIYHENYRTALLLSNTIEGNGVKVVDLSENTQNTTNNICLVEYKNISVIKTVNAIASFFHCEIRKVETGSVDIIIRLNRLEKEWEIDD